MSIHFKYSIPWYKPWSSVITRYTSTIISQKSGSNAHSTANITDLLPSISKWLNTGGHFGFSVVMGSPKTVQRERASKVNSRNECRRWRRCVNDNARCRNEDDHLWGNCFCVVKVLCIIHENLLFLVHHFPHLWLESRVWHQTIWLHRANIALVEHFCSYA